MAATARRVAIGFNGGQVLSLRVSEDELSSLQKALGRGGWHDLESDEGPVRLDLAQVAYVRAESEEQRVGFGA
jgi:hypothetical protein